MNLRVLKKLRGGPKVGDVFTMLPPDGEYVFGRVISTDANPLGAGGGVLIYVYRTRSKDKAAVPRLARSDLLLPPLMTNKLPWTKGYFELIEHRALDADDKLPVHCFERSWSATKQYFDERGCRLPGPVGLVGTWGLESFRTIDDKISKALGIPLSPEE